MYGSFIFKCFNQMDILHDKCVVKLAILDKQKLGGDEIED